MSDQREREAAYTGPFGLVVYGPEGNGYVNPTRDAAQMLQSTVRRLQDAGFRIEQARAQQDISEVEREFLEAAKAWEVYMAENGTRSIDHEHAAIWVRFDKARKAMLAAQQQGAVVEAKPAPSEPTDTEQDLIVRLWEAWNGDVNAGTQFIPNPNDPSTIGASTADAMWRVERFVRSLIASKQADTERMRREIKRLRRAVHDLVDGLDDDDVAVIEAAKELVDSRTGDHLTDDGHNSVTICPHALAGLEECVEAIRERDEAAVDAAMKQGGGA